MRKRITFSRAIGIANLKESELFMFLCNSGEEHPQSEIKNILFDYGNTLVLDPFRSILELKAQNLILLLKANNVQIGKSELIDAWTEANNETNYPYISHLYKERRIVENAIRKLGISVNRILVDGLLNTYRDGFKETIRTDRRNKHVKQILVKLKSKGLQLGVLSNERKIFLRKL